MAGYYSLGGDHVTTQAIHMAYVCEFAGELLRAQELD